MGETGPALKHWERALHLFETAGLKIFAFDPLMHLGITYLASGDTAQAIRHFERAFSRRRIGNRAVEGLGPPIYRSCSIGSSTAR